MIAQVLRLTRWELFKVRKRWMPRILLVVTLVVVQATLWGFYAAYGNVGNEYNDGYPGVRGIVTISCAEILDGTAAAKVETVIEEMREDVRKRIEQRRERGRCPSIIEQIEDDRERHRGFFVLPGGLANSLGVAHYIGVFLVMVLGASSMGVEYGWGTLRTALARGTGRRQFLGAKALSLVLLSAAGLLVVSLTVTISSLITASLTLGDGGGKVGSGQWSTAAVMFGKVVYGLVPFVILALFFTILTSSSSMGIAMSGAYYFAEFLLVRILGGLFDWFSNVTDYLLGANTTIWMTTTEVVTTAGSASLFDIADPPGTLHAFLVLLIYVVVLGGVATWLFQRRDIAGARGE